MISESVKSLLKNKSFLPQSDIAVKLKIDKVRLSGYLEAMVDYGDLSVKKVGNSKVYYLERKEGK